MPLEATMMIIDNSDYMLNGDYQPTRFEAQSDAVNTIFQTKTDSNPENTVGLMTMAGKGPEVLVTHSKDLGQILSALHRSRSMIGGASDLSRAISIAQLALKHRENKNQRQRIIVFVASPLDQDEKSMVKLAKKLKKNNVAVDVITFGDGLEEGEPGTSVLKTFVENVSSGDNSHIISVPPGSLLLSDVIISSPILAEDRGIPEGIPGGVGGEGASGSGAGAGSGFEFGVDPSLDPELAMALRMSMEEEAARQAAAQRAQQQADSSTEAPAPPATSTGVAAAVAPASEEEDEDEELQRALALSRGEEGEDVEMEGEEGEEDEELMDDEEEDEEAEIARAIAMSMEDQSNNDKNKTEKK